MEDSTDKTSKGLISVLIALITVCGTIAAAYFSSRPVESSAKMEERKVEPSEPFSEIPKIRNNMSFCEKLVFTTSDADNIFDGVKGEFIGEDEYYKTYSSIITLQGVSPQISFDKEDRTWDFEAELYNGLNAEIAEDTYYSTIKSVPACLTDIATDEYRKEHETYDYIATEFVHDEYYIYVSWYTYYENYQNPDLRNIEIVSLEIRRSF